MSQDNTQMMAISIRGDYVMDIISGKKPVEYRVWQTNYRGPLLLCSTVKRAPNACPGYAIAVVDLLNCVPVTFPDGSKQYDWLIQLDSLIQPVKIKGQLKLFHVPTAMIKPVKRVTDWWKMIMPKVYEPRKKQDLKNKKKPFTAYTGKSIYDITLDTAKLAFADKSRVDADDFAKAVYEQYKPGKTPDTDEAINDAMWLLGCDYDQSKKQYILSNKIGR